MSSVCRNHRSEKGILRVGVLGGADIIFDALDERKLGAAPRLAPPLVARCVHIDPHDTANMVFLSRTVSSLLYLFERHLIQLKRSFGFRPRHLVLSTTPSAFAASPSGPKRKQAFFLLGCFFDLHRLRTRHFQIFEHLKQGHRPRDNDSAPQKRWA